MSGANRRPLTGPQGGRRRAAANAGPRLPGWDTIRGRLAVVLAVPTCLLLVVAAVGVAWSTQQAGQASATRKEVAVALGAQSLVHELQRERGLSSGMLGGDASYRDRLDAQRPHTDTARAGLTALVSHDPTGTAPAVATALRLLDALGAQRAAVVARATDRTATLRFYTSAITALSRAAAGGQAGDADRQLRSGLAALQALGDATEAVALERGTLNGVFAAGSFRPADYLGYARVRAEREAALSRFAEVATPTEQSGLNSAFAGSAAHSVAVIEQRATDGADGRALHVAPAAWWPVATTLVDDLYSVQQRLAGDVRARAATVDDQATFWLWACIAAAALVAGLTAFLAVAASRSITRPLDALAREAEDVAGNRLPQAVARVFEKGVEAAPESPEPAPHAPEPRRGAREITAVTAALRGVEQTAVSLAVEQAVLRRNTSESLANLGRRNQNLIRRQLSFISGLERLETDPDGLSNLFELDHLATRMRRNAESLLVLAGERAPRGRHGAVHVADLVASAVSEVEQYRRVTLGTLEPCRLRGGVASELSHLMAELLENGLTFSPPGEPVEVHGWQDSAEYCLAVVDHGVGMKPHDMERANGRLSGAETFLVAPTRFLGHYVVGRLADRLGAHVRLFDTPEGGVSALVVLPPKLLAREDARRSGSMLTGFRAGVQRAATPPVKDRP